ncbi:MAG: hypothetical protein HC889_18440 [Synechococcaceae cyanobacterium SM1_2_3]|nr:hypothetical protein [Synechococcaceae cyanobacterium SM1_2_3]
MDDLGVLQSLGASAGYLAVLVLTLYVNSETSHLLYAQPMVIWLFCPVLLYWISRVWLITHRGQMHDDPVLFALIDPPSRYAFLACALIVLGARPQFLAAMSAPLNCCVPTVADGFAHRSRTPTGSGLRWAG